MNTLEDIKRFVENDLDSEICNFCRKQNIPLDGFIVSSADIEDDYVYVIFKEPFFIGERYKWMDEDAIVNGYEEVIRKHIEEFMLGKHGIVTTTSNWTSMTFTL